MTTEKFPRQLIRKAEDEMSPLRVLEGVGELRKYLDDLERQALLDARKLGVSPSEMADALGITRQGVHHKLKKIDRELPAERPVRGVLIPELEPEPH
jgi:DNA invertase Pin-like site-specific DNA recombinase